MTVDSVWGFLNVGYQRPCRLLMAENGRRVWTGFLLFVFFVYAENAKQNVEPKWFKKKVKQNYIILVFLKKF